MRGIICWLLLVMIWLPALGCGSAKTFDVSGVVTLDGKPLPSGDIVFVPADKTRPVGVAIKDGRYQLRSLPGKMRVEIRPGTEILPTKESMKAGRRQIVDEPYIPPQYNDSSTLSATIPTADGKNQFDFALRSK
jgi:hypothetical protein